jgi:hypothetical protein
MIHQDAIKNVCSSVKNINYNLEMCNRLGTGNL